MRASETRQGGWLAWIERNGEPIMVSEDRPRIFDGPTCYQAQCAAVKWLRGESRETSKSRHSRKKGIRA